MPSPKTPWQGGAKMKWKIGNRLVLGGFIIATAILAFVGWQSYRNTARFAEASEWRKHTYEVLRNLDETVARLVDAETGQRGYLLTGEESYLEPYRAAIKNIDQMIGDLKSLTSDNPNQQKRIHILEPLVERKLAELQQTINVRKNEGLTAANRMVLEGSGKRWMDQIRVIIAEMANEEKDLLKIRTQEANESVARSVRTILTGTLLSISLLVLCFGLLHRELSERKKAQAALAKSEKWFSTTLASIGDAVIATDMNGGVTFMNSIAQSLTGWSQAEATGKSMDLVFDIVNRETRRPVENPVKKVFREGKVVGLADHTLLLSKDGKEFDIEDSAAPILTDAGEGFGVVLVFRDITERKRAEETLRQSQERYHLLFDSIPHPVWVYDLKSLAILDVNHSAVRNYGYSREEFLSLSLKDIRPPEDVPALLESAATAPPDTESDSVWKHRKKDGTLIDVEITSHPLIYGGGDARLVVATDITTRKRAEEALQTSEEKFRSVVQTANDAIVTADSHGSITDFNRGAEAIFGYSAQEVIGRPLTVLMPDRFKEPHQQGFKRYLETGQAHVIGKTVELAGKRKDGTEFPIELSLSSWKTRAGLFFTGVLSDITERKRMQELMLHAKEEAERASKFKDQFLSTMSHELRTPLNAVLGFSDLLADERYGPLNDRQQRYVAHIHTGGKHLLKLISDILDLSKIEAGRMELTRENVAVASAFAEVISALYPLAEKKSQALLQQVEPHLHVNADAMRFKQVLMNLAGNAIKFTPEGGRIELGARQVDEQVRIEVRDNGPGIPPDQQQRIFEAFFRLTETGSATEGTGLGLAITSRLVELHGSKLGIESQPGEGACFYFSLPLVAIARDLPGQTSMPMPRARKAPRILIIEDNEATGQLIQSQLTSSGYETLKCGQPARATEMAAEHQPDAITLDLLMQPVHGLEVLLQLKNDPRTSKIPVIVVTIVDQPGVGTALGADEYLIKPVDKVTLLAAVERCLRSRGGAAPARTILVVEDDVSTLEMIVELLKGYGYAVSTATDGAQARASVAQALPELVILDLVLPKMSGFELLAEWRSNPRTAELSVFVLTSKDLTKEEEKYIHAHAESLFRKQNEWREPLIKQLERVVTSPSLENA